MTYARRRAVDLGVVLGALALRLWRAGAQSMWYDEGTSAAVALRSPTQILIAAAHDVHPPLYYLLLAGWARLVGMDPAALRALSALLGASAVAGVLAIVHRLLPQRPWLAWLAGALAAAAPFQVWYGQELRMYVLALALGTVLVALALRAGGLADGSAPWSPRPEGSRSHAGPGRAPSWTWLAITVATTAALYTQYVSGAATVLAANAVACGGWLASRRNHGRWPWRRLLPWAVTQALALLLFLPWLAYAWPTLSAWPAVGGQLDAVGILWDGVRTYALGTAAPEPLLRWTPGILAVAALGALLGLARRHTRPATVVALAWAAAPPALILVLGLRRSTYKPKFLLPGAPGFELLLALGIALGGLAAMALARRAFGSARGGSASARVAAAVGLAVAVGLTALVLVPRAATLRANALDPRWQRDDYRGVIAEVDARAGAQDAVVLVAPTQIELFELYTRREHATYPLPLDRPPDPEQLSGRMKILLAEHRDVYALLYGEGEADPQGLVEMTLDVARAKAFERWAGDLRFAAWARLRQPSAVIGTFRAPVAQLEGAGGRLSLSELALGPRHAHPGDMLTVQATWHAEIAPDADLKTFLQLLGADGRPVAQRDMRPVNGRERTSRWLNPRRAERDPMALALPLELAPGRYTLILGLYDPASGERLTVRDGPAVQGSETRAADRAARSSSDAKAPDDVRAPGSDGRSSNAEAQTVPAAGESAPEVYAAGDHLVLGTIEIVAASGR